MKCWACGITGKAGLGPWKTSSKHQALKGASLSAQGEGKGLGFCSMWGLIHSQFSDDLWGKTARPAAKGLILAASNTRSWPGYWAISSLHQLGSEIVGLGELEGLFFCLCQEVTEWTDIVERIQLTEWASHLVDKIWRTWSSLQMTKLEWSKTSLQGPNQPMTQFLRSSDREAIQLLWFILDYHCFHMLYLNIFNNILLAEI